MLLLLKFLEFFREFGACNVRIKLCRFLYIFLYKVKKDSIFVFRNYRYEGRLHEPSTLIE